MQIVSEQRNEKHHHVESISESEGPSFDSIKLIDCGVIRVTDIGVIEKLSKRAFRLNARLKIGILLTKSFSLIEEWSIEASFSVSSSSNFLNNISVNSSLEEIIKQLYKIIEIITKKNNRNYLLFLMSSKSSLFTSIFVKHSSISSIL